MCERWLWKGRWGRLLEGPRPGSLGMSSMSFPAIFLLCRSTVRKALQMMRRFDSVVRRLLISSAMLSLVVSACSTTDLWREISISSRTAASLSVHWSFSRLSLTEGENCVANLRCLLVAVLPKMILFSKC